MTRDVPGGVVKIIELVGSSPQSFSDAVRNAVKTASKTIHDIRGVDVLSTTAEVDGNGDITNYKAHCKLAFLVREEERESSQRRETAEASV